ncbi:translocation and assembly module lipoprotein TamL [Aureibaculum algae]
MRYKHKNIAIIRFIKTNILIKYAIGFMLSVLLILFQSCSIQKYIPNKERLYIGASIDIKSDSIVKNEKALEENLKTAIQKKTNKKILGWYYGLYYHFKSQNKRQGFINRWLNKKIGEEPVYQSDINTTAVKEVLTNRLENNGFYYNNVTSNWTSNDKKKTASIDYNITVQQPYRMESYQLDTLQPPIYKEMQGYISDTPFKKDMRFNLSLLKLERDRIDNGLKMKGYYNFNSNFLIFEADTNRYKDKRFDLFLKLKKDVPKKAIVPYRISKINIYSNYDIQQDSLPNKVVRYNHKNFIEQIPYFKTKYLDPYITLKEGELYNPQTSKNTARRLSTIGSYKFVNIQYNQLDTIAKNDSIGFLETNIFLSPLNKRAFKASLEAVSKSNNFAGPTLALTYTNRNLFGGGEILNLSTNIGYEWQITGGNSNGTSILQLGLSSELIYPRIIFPIKISSNYFKYAIPKTKMSLGLDYLQRTQLYTLLSGTAQFGYLWNANRYVTHEIIPISTTYTQLSNTTEAFEEILSENEYLSSSFDQEFISGLNYSFTYNEMVDTKKTHQFYINSTLDIVGNSLSLFGKNNGEDSKTIFGLEFAQYAKADLDLHYHFNFGRDQKIATRVFAGYGYAYGNSDVLPFTKQYNAGGPYSVRAFQIGTLGPGQYDEDADGGDSDYLFYNSGNIKLEANIEYRFPIYSFVRGAVFADAGNIWTSKENETFPNGKFTDNFINELGIGAGIGLRIDVQGFVIRFDLAAPFHDPKEESYNFKWDEPVFNFAIGYPF